MGGACGFSARHLAVRLHQKILTVRANQFGVAFHHQQVLGILPFCLMCEIEAAGNERALIDDHHLVVSDRVLRIKSRAPNPWSSKSGRSE